MNEKLNTAKINIHFNKIEKIEEYLLRIFLI